MMKMLIKWGCKWHHYDVRTYERGDLCTGGPSGYGTVKYYSKHNRILDHMRVMWPHMSVMWLTFHRVLSGRSRGVVRGGAGCWFGPVAPGDGRGGGRGRWRPRTGVCAVLVGEGIGTSHRRTLGRSAERERERERRHGEYGKASSVSGLIVH